MKRRSLVMVVMLSACVVARSQSFLFGTNQVGNGNIIQYDISGNQLKSLFSFSNDGLLPRGFSDLTRGDDGHYYGVTTAGGKTGGGVIFQFDSSTRAYRVVYNFSTATGEFPTGKLLASRDGKLYGMAAGSAEGDPHFTENTGFIFSFDPMSQQYTVVWDIGSYGHIPVGGLAEADNGKLYGIISNGQMFSFDMRTSTFAIEYLFNQDIRSGMTKGSDGKFYGIFGLGGPESYGVVYSFDPNTRSYTVEHFFKDAASDGAYPYGGLSPEYNGTFYGSTLRGGAFGNGILFSYNITSGLFSLLYSFPDDRHDDRSSYYSLAVGADGTLYGNEQSGPFSYDVVNGMYTLLNRQTKSSGSSFEETFVINKSGLLTVHPGRNDYSVIKPFEAAGGLKPANTLISGSGQILYGTTTQGGVNKRGGLFSFDPANSSFQMLADFNARVPDIVSPLVFIEGRGIYFISSHGGVQDQNEGELIHYDLLADSFEVVHQFDAWGDGLAYSLMPSVLIKGPGGNLYGTTNDAILMPGVLYRFSTADNHYEKLVRLPGPPQSKSLVIAKDGKVYGHFSNILEFYSVDPVTKIFTPYPYSRAEFGWEVNDLLAIDSLGKIYAANTYTASNRGNIFRFDPTTKGFRRVRYLNDSTGSPMLDPMLIDSDGMLYGSTLINNSEEDSRLAPLNQLISVNTNTGEFRMLAMLEGATIFRPMVLYTSPSSDHVSNVTIHDTIVRETDFKAVIRIHLSKPLDHTLRLFFRTRPGTATPYKPYRDFIRGKGLIYLKKGAVDKVIRITVLKDELKEGDENFYMHIIKTPHNKDSFQIEREQALITIIDETPVNAISAPVDDKQKEVQGIKTNQTQEINVVVSPNPSSSAFRLQLMANSTPTSMRIVNVLGVVFERYDAVTSGKGLVVGSGWAPGVYFAVIEQGKNTRTLKLVKTRQ